MTEQWESLEYAVFSRDRLDDLAACAADGDAKAGAAAAGDLRMGR